jgi:lipoprotein-anchoring transpeptidase ErfK/SrfK
VGNAVGGISHFLVSVMFGKKSFLWIALVASFVLINNSAAAAQQRKPVNVREAEQLLSDLGYWISKIDAVADASTRHSIMAFQKVEGLKRTGTLTAAVMARLRWATRPVAKHQTSSAHIEVDLTRQVLFLTNDEGTVRLILPVSSGNEKRYFDEGKWQIAHTPRGNFRIIRKINGVRKAPLGNLYYPNYIVNGVAIHGSSSIPASPASHGCIRIPRTADKMLFGLAPLGMEVFVYD